MGSYRMCLCFTRRFPWKEAQPPGDVKEAFAAYAEGDTRMNAEQLLRFLVDVQGDSRATVADAELLIEHFRRLNHRYLVHQDMTAPLSDYFIYTGHNSYLTGNQLSSDCSDIPIKKALQKGIKVIELDIWPNSTKEGVDVCHGGTLTSPVELIKCLRTIRDNAFVTSRYPVIITLEDHLTPDLQAKVAKMVTQTFEDTLYYPKSEFLNEFPSPEALKRRIILSTKPPKEYLESELSKDKDGESEGESWGRNINIEDDDDTKMLRNSSPEYRQLITITAGKPKGGLKEALKVDPNKVRRLSLSEQELERAARSYGKDIVRFTQKNLLRIYPKGTRVNSSNYNPLIGWMHGAQMVAFNMQGYGRSLWLMQGFYRANGGCGFVKKPDFLMNVRAERRSLRSQSVKVYMGDGWRQDFKDTDFDLYSPPDFYARVGIAGVPADNLMKRTRVIEDHWAPAWEQEFTFPLTVHEYDMSEKDDFGGQTCLPVSELRPGIRAVPLYDRKGTKFSSVRLLMRFQFL
ncbi:unnamed protein product [Spirodela intermedia]|uniref:Phosphoinositide phospholipase C n=1 Tax=Spirodela intermedia TaxID=51605 RepID=A0A7I8IBQ5_SPIIN|nr:unnamed protein product [Spirodela intermedia]CAA6654763.1 unnamed protein product [Spirodela intermedia]